MSSFVLTNGYISIAGTALSSAGRQVTITYSAEQQDDTAFGDTGRSRSGDGSLHVANVAGNVDATLFSLVGTVVACKFRSVNATISATNPEYQGNGLVTSYAPIGAGVGETAKARLSIVGADGVALIRATS